MAALSFVWELLTNYSVLLGLLIICLYTVYRHFLIERSNGLPPGPRFRLPLIGNMLDVNQDMRKFLRKYRRKYGDIYSLYFGNELTIVIAGYSKLKEAFVKNGNIFEGRPNSRHLTNDITKGRGIVFVSGELWREHNQFALATLRRFGLGKSVMEDLIQTEVKSLLKVFESKQQSPFQPKGPIQVCISNVMNGICFGKHFQHDDPRYKVILEKLKIHFTNIGLANLSSYIPALSILPGDLFKVKASIQNAEDIYDFFLEFALEHMENYDENNINDFTAAFIHEMKKQEYSKETTTFTLDQLVYTLGDLFFGGADTAPGAILWSLAYLVNYPDIQEEMYNSIKDEVGTDRLPELKDKPKIPLVEAVLQESLRHANLTFTTLPRAPSRDIEIGGYLIPKGTAVLGDLDSVMNDKDTWKDPEVFRPQRFIDESGSLKTMEQFIPFSLGSRSCLGESLPKQSTFLVLSAIIQNFKVTAAPGEDLSSQGLSEFGITHIPKRYSIVATPRQALKYCST